MDFLNSVDYKIIDATPELAKADLNIPASGSVDIRDLLNKDKKDEA